MAKTAIARFDTQRLSSKEPMSTDQFVVLDAVRFDTGTQAWVKAQANAAANYATHIVVKVYDSTNFEAAERGLFELDAVHGKTLGTDYWLDATTAGANTSTAPANRVLLFIPLTTTRILVRVQEEIDTSNVAYTNVAQTFSAKQSFSNGNLALPGSTSGETLLNAQAIASGALILPSETGTLISTATANVNSASWVIDEDDMTSDSNQKVPTQQSVKAYVDANAGSGINFLFTPIDTASSASSNSFSSSITLQAHDQVTFSGRIFDSSVSIQITGLGTGNFYTRSGSEDWQTASGGNNFQGYSPGTSNSNSNDLRIIGNPVSSKTMHFVAKLTRFEQRIQVVVHATHFDTSNSANSYHVQGAYFLSGFSNQTGNLSITAANTSSGKEFRMTAVRG